MKKLVLLSITLLIIFSCEEDNNVDINSNPIEDNINFYPDEIFESYNSIDTPDLKLVFATTESYDYGGGILHCTNVIENQELVVKFDSVQIFTGGILEWRPAIAYVDLPENINRIKLVNGNLIDEYDILITKEKVEIDSIVQNYTSLFLEKIFRYPENTFNFTCWTDATDENLCSDFLDILNNELSLLNYEFIGEGKIPFPYYSSNEPNHFTAVFKYESESDYDKAGELLRTFTLERIPQNQGKSISLWGWNNKNFHSYTFYE